MLDKLNDKTWLILCDSCKKSKHFLYNVSEDEIEKLFESQEHGSWLETEGNTWLCLQCQSILQIFK